MSARSEADSYDVIVVGARCAGAPTAMLLARRGFRVLVVDRATFPSDTLSTHCVSASGMALLERWGVLDAVLSTGVPVAGSLCLTLGDLELTDPMGPTTTISPRRILLDALLVDAARAAGAELREQTTVQELLWDDGRVSGIVASDSAPPTARARLVIGADGVRSFVARAVGASIYNPRPGKGSGYYAYFDGVAAPAVELAFNQRNYAAFFPTNEGLTCVFAGKPDDQFSGFRRDLEGVHLATVRKANPRLGALLAAGRRVSRFFAYRTVPGFFRQSFGPGWALVGDAAFHKDPITGMGIGDALRDAELVADAAAQVLDGATSEAEAFGAYQARRDELSLGVYEATQDIAGLDWVDDDLPDIFLRLGAAQQAAEQLTVSQVTGRHPAEP